VRTASRVAVFAPVPKAKVRNAALPGPASTFAVVPHPTFRPRGFGIGLYAEPNALVYVALAFGALSIAFAIFLIFEFGMPFTGLYRVSPAALEQAIEFVDK
jgi:hypothetical protein